MKRRENGGSPKYREIEVSLLTNEANRGLLLQGDFPNATFRMQKIEVPKENQSRNSTRAVAVVVGTLKSAKARTSQPLGRHMARRDPQRPAVARRAP